MEWIDLLRAVTVIGLAIGAWQTWKALPEPTRVDGKRYYRQADGSFRTFVGRRVRDPALLQRLEAADAERSAGTSTGA